MCSDICLSLFFFFLDYPEYYMSNNFPQVELVMLSNHLILCLPLRLLSSVFSSIRVFSNELSLEKTEEPEIKLSTSAGSLKKQGNSKKNYLCFIDYTKVFDCVDHNKPENPLRDGNTRAPYPYPEKPVCGVKKQQLEPYMEQ